MQINNLQQLQQRMQQTLDACYVVYGTEPLLINDSVHCIQQCAQQQAYTVAKTITIDTQDAWLELLNGYQQRDLFTTQQLIIATIHDSQLNNKNYDVWLPKITQLLQTTNHKNNILLLIAHTMLPAALLQQAHWQLLLQTAVVLTIWPITTRQLPQWLANRAHQLGISLRYDALQLLSMYCANNLQAGAQILQQLANLPRQPSVQVDVTMLQPLLINQAKYSVFDLSTAVLQRNLLTSLRISNYLAQQFDNKLFIIGILAKDLRLMLQLKHMVQQPTPNLHKIWQEHRVNITKQNLLLAAKQRFSTALLNNALAELTTLDYLAKQNETMFWYALNDWLKLIIGQHSNWQLQYA